MSVNNEPITTNHDIKIAVKKAKQNKQTNITIVFGSLVGFAMSGEGIPTLQADQFNVIAHHLHKINTEGDLWPDKEKWPHQLDSPKILPIQLSVNKLRQQSQR